MLQTKAGVAWSCHPRLGGDLTPALGCAQEFPTRSWSPCSKKESQEQFLHMLGTIHALKHKHTWATSQAVDIAYAFRNAAAVRWGESCAISGVLLTRCPCKRDWVRIQTVPRWRTVKSELVLVQALLWTEATCENMSFFSPSFGSCIVRIQEEI